jgi:hypothetical protein
MFHPPPHDDIPDIIWVSRLLSLFLLLFIAVLHPLRSMLYDFCRPSGNAGSFNAALLRRILNQYFAPVQQTLTDIHCRPAAVHTNGQAANYKEFIKPT